MSSVVVVIAGLVAISVYTRVIFLFGQPVCRWSGCQRVVESGVEFVLLLFGQAPGADNETALQIAAHDQCLDEQPHHDGFAGARVVGQQETQCTEALGCKASSWLIGGS